MNNENNENKKIGDVEAKKSLKGVIISYSICIFIGLGICLWYLLAQKVFGMTEKRVIFSALCDAFFVPGALLVGFGALYKVAVGGFLDGVAYGLRRAIFYIIPGARLKEENYADYKERKEKSRKKFKTLAPFVTGAVFVIIAAIFLVLHNAA